MSLKSRLLVFLLTLGDQAIVNCQQEQPPWVLHDKFTCGTSIQLQDEGPFDREDAAKDRCEEIAYKCYGILRLKCYEGSQFLLCDRREIQSEAILESSDDDCVVALVVPDGDLSTSTTTATTHTGTTMETTVAPTTSAATTTPHTVTVIVPAKSATPANSSAACDDICNANGAMATCREHILESTGKTRSMPSSLVPCSSKRDIISHQKGCGTCHHCNVCETMLVALHEDTGSGSLLSGSASRTSTALWASASACALLGGASALAAWYSGRSARGELLLLPQNDESISLPLVENGN